jgi:hypothetical protein
MSEKKLGPKKKGELQSRDLASPLALLLFSLVVVLYTTRMILIKSDLKRILSCLLPKNSFVPLSLVEAPSSKD